MVLSHTFTSRTSRSVSSAENRSPLQHAESAIWIAMCQVQAHLAFKGGDDTPIGVIHATPKTHLRDWTQPLFLLCAHIMRRVISSGVEHALNALAPFRPCAIDRLNRALSLVHTVQQSPFKANNVLVHFSILSYFPTLSVALGLQPICVYWRCSIKWVTDTVSFFFLTTLKDCANSDC